MSVAVLAIATLLVPFTGALAADTGGGSVQSYAADRQLDFGTIVELTGDKSDRVKPASKAQLQNMFGVVVDPRLLSVRLVKSNLQNETYVAVSGTYSVLVSDEGGEIAPGDHITMSSINGIAMKAGTEEPTVFGRAVSGFDKTSVDFGTTTLTDPETKISKTVRMGSVMATIDIKRNPNEKSTKTNVPEFLERVGQAIAEKEVSPIRIYLSLAITAVSLVSALIVLYTGVRNGIISIGRNPMSKRSIFRALLEIILTSFLILIIGLFAVYLLLRL